MNKGGCLVLLHGLRAFLPGSHLCGAIASEELIGEVSTTLTYTWLTPPRMCREPIGQHRKEERDNERGDAVNAFEVFSLRPDSLFGPDPFLAVCVFVVGFLWYSPSR